MDGGSRPNSRVVIPEYDLEILVSDMDTGYSDVSHRSLIEPKLFTDLAHARRSSRGL